MNSPLFVNLFLYEFLYLFHFSIKLMRIYSNSILTFRISSRVLKKKRIGIQSNVHVFIHCDLSPVPFPPKTSMVNSHFNFQNM